MCRIAAVAVGVVNVSCGKRTLEEVGWSKPKESIPRKHYAVMITPESLNNHSVVGMIPAPVRKEMHTILGAGLFASMSAVFAVGNSVPQRLLATTLKEPRRLSIDL